MLTVRNRTFWAAVPLLCICLLLLDCATEEETVRPQNLPEGVDLEFVGNRIELQNPMPRNGEEVGVMVMVRNRGSQDAKEFRFFSTTTLESFQLKKLI